MKKAIGAVSGWTTCDTHTTFSTSYTSVSAHLQETDNWTTSAVNVPGYIVRGTDHGRTAILCPREVYHFRRSWVDNDRCTAILVGSMMLLTEYMPHSGCDEEDYIEALETVRAIPTEGRKVGAVDFFHDGEINIELRLGKRARTCTALTALNMARSLRTRL